MKSYLTLLVATCLVAGASVSVSAMAQPGQGGVLPPGLEKNVERGKPLPPGWQKKLAVGEILDYDIYRHGRVIKRHGEYVTVDVEGHVLRLIADTLEIVEILHHR